MTKYIPYSYRYMVQMFDTNQDGCLDKKEFIDMWTSMFGSGK